MKHAPIESPLENIYSEPLERVKKFKQYAEKFEKEIASLNQQVQEMEQANKAVLQRINQIKGADDNLRQWGDEAEDALLGAVQTIKKNIGFLEAQKQQIENLITLFTKMDESYADLLREHMAQEQVDIN